MSSAREEARHLAIQAGVCKRLTKDLQSYRGESKQEKAAIDALAEKVAGEAPGSEGSYRLRQAREAHAETLGMIVDSQRRLEEALSCLEALLDTARKGAAAAAVLADQIAAAEAVVAAAREALAARD